MLPAIAPDTRGLRVMSGGWLLGKFKKNRFEPSQAMASALVEGEVNKIVNYEHDDPSVIKYLKGETLSVDKDNGWHLVTVDGLGLGFGKVVSRRLKNKLEATWRWQ